MEVKKLSWSEFIAQFDESVRDAIAVSRKKDGVDGVVMLVNHVFDSSRFGDKTAMVYGPGCTYKSLQVIRDQRCGVYITGLPSSASFVESYTEEVPT